MQCVTCEVAVQKPFTLIKAKSGFQSFDNLARSDFLGLLRVLDP